MNESMNQQFLKPVRKYLRWCCHCDFSKCEKDIEQVRVLRSSDHIELSEKIGVNSPSALSSEP